MSNLEFDRHLGIGSRGRWLKKLIGGGAALGIIGLLVTLLAWFVKVPQLDLTGWPANRRTLFRHLDDPRIKGIQPPDTRTLALKNSDSWSNLEIFLEKRGSRDFTDREIAEKSLQKVIKDESNNPSATTLAYLLALDGQNDLEASRRETGMARLEEAAKVCPDNVVVKFLRLRAYEDANRDLERMTLPWSRSTEEKIQENRLKIDLLRQALRPFLVTTLEPQRDVSLGWMLLSRASTPSTPRPDACQTAYFGLVAGTCSPIASRGVDLRDLHLGWGALGPATPVANRARVEALGTVGAPAAYGAGTDRALTVGINSYDPSSGFASLEFAGSDASGVAQAFHRLGYAATSLVERAATRQRILAVLEHETLVSRPGDNFVFYFSGHGFSDVHSHGALVTASDGNAPAGVVSLAEVAQILSFHRGTATVIVDGCLNSLNVTLGDTIRGNYGPGHATFILAAPRGLALESPRLKAGLYSYALLDFLGREANARHNSAQPHYLDFEKLVAATSGETAKLARELYGLEQRPERIVNGVVIR